MTDTSHVHNFISRYDTPLASYRFYHDNTIIFTGNDLSYILFPGFYHELRTKTIFPDFFFHCL